MLFACPRCHGELVETPEQLLCPSCQSAYPVVEGIPVFCNPDTFYEGKWAELDKSAGSLRNWLVRKQRFFLRRLEGAKGLTLDLGCGGGWLLFAKSREVVGVDVSQRSLATARLIYSHAAAADLSDLPFGDETFSLVVSSDVLGHIPLEAKDRVLSEICRVLRPGGRTLHYIEANGQDPINKMARVYPELYQKYIIDPEGHIGLETASEIAARFRQHGLIPVKEVPCYKGLLYVNRIVQYFDNEYRKSSRMLAASVAICRLLMRSPIVENLTNVGVTMAMEIGDRLLPADWAGGMLVEYRKQG